MRRPSPAGQSTATSTPMARRRRWLRAAAWFTALLLAAVASGIALSRRAQAVEPLPYESSAELSSPVIVVIGAAGR